jgi:hypothetical protein
MGRFIFAATRVGAGLALGLTLFALTPTNGAAQGAEGLRPPLRSVAGPLATFVKEGKKEATVAMGAFRAAGADESLSPAIQKMLGEELEARGLRVNASARMKVEGEYRLASDKEQFTFKLTARVVDSKAGGKPLKEYTSEAHRISGLQEAAPLTGLTLADVGAGVSPEKEHEAVVEGRNTPSVDITGARLRAKPGGRYAVEIHVKSGDKYYPRGPEKVGGKAYVKFERGEVFAVKLINDTDYEAAADLSLDGLSMFAFSERKGYRHVVVPKRGSVQIDGWFVSLTDTKEFLFTEYPRSAAFELRNPANVGTITVSFAAAWAPKGSPPPDEGALSKSLPDSAVGAGKTVRSPYTEVQRMRGRVRDVVTVRYQRKLAP